jgi:FkbM family methyltransferase
MDISRARIRRAWHRVLPEWPLPLRIAPGLWWIARHDAVSDGLFAGTFELGERAAFADLVKPGMTVVDVGAHAGLYTLMASRLVGDRGRVVAFEPSPRERARLVKHIRLNRCANVTVEPVALGEADGEADLFVVQGSETGCNSLRPGDIGDVRPVRVPLRRLDDYFARGEIGQVDVVKMDVEGGELSVLRGGETLFRSARPTLFCEIEETRIRPWGYTGRDIVDLVAVWGYEWFALAGSGALQPLAANRCEFSGNYVAQPR